MNLKSLSQLFLASLMLFSLGACSLSPTASTPTLTASGLIAADDIRVAPETGGTVTEVNFREGDAVEAGAVLFRINADLLQAYLEQAQAGVASAEAAVTTAQAALTSAQLQAELARTGAHLQATAGRQIAWQGTGSDAFTLPVWYFDQTEALAAAQAELTVAEAARATEQANLDAVLKDSSNADLVTAEKRLAEAQMAYDIADRVLKLAQAATDKADLEKYAQTEFDAAQTELDAAQTAYERLLSDSAAADVLEARARVSVAQAHYDAAQDALDQLRTGEESLQVQAALAGVKQAEAAVTQAENGLTQAKAAQKVLEVQIEQTVVRAPAAGIILTRNLEPGELVSPGAVVFIIGQLAEVKLTVYLPEDRYGKVETGQTVEVKVDSFPGTTFTGTVMRIADEAEFTPRNVQTVDGRRSTVFAIEIRVPNPDLKLKPGMPADVTFGR